MTVATTSTQPLRTSLFAEIAGYDIFIEMDGSGPFMIMTHGLGANTNVFHPLMELFAHDFTVVRFDWPGSGKSGLNKFGVALTVPGLLEVLKGVMDYLNIGSAVILGHSLGGVAGMHMAAAYPKRVNGLAVVGAGRTRAIDSPAKRITLSYAVDARARGLWPVVDDRVEYNIPSAIESPLLARALLRAVTSSTNAEGYAQVCEAMCADSHKDPDYSKITCPTCVVGGEFDAIAPITVCKEIAGLIARSGRQPTLKTLKTGHMMIIEDYEGVAATVRQMLEDARKSGEAVRGRIGE
jgi:pimeloyl-ACP methyl ester carboxylesterase